MRKPRFGSSRKREASNKTQTVNRLLSKQVVWRPIETLAPFPNNAREHSDAQIAHIARCMSQGWTSPILIDENGTILAGHARLAAAKRLGLTLVPTLMLSGLSDAQKRAIVIAENKLAEKADWNIEILKDEVGALVDLNFDVELTGFTTGEVDILLDDSPPTGGLLPEDDMTGLTTSDVAISCLGDVWELGRHRIYCGDSRLPESYHQLLGDERAQMVVTDLPFNQRISGHVCGRGKRKHREFAMASGEMTDAQFLEFVETAMTQAVAVTIDGSIHYWFIDWRNLPILLKAGMRLYSDWKNLIVWTKTNAGQGSFYRSHHELIPVFKNGNAPNVNNFGLGSNGRYRTNSMTYPGGGGVCAQRREELDMHPTVKPVALIADLIRDCSHRGGIILDLFGGSGTTILGAERTGRIGRLIEIDPLYVDLTIRRWEAATGENARHAATGKTFAQTANERQEQNVSPAAQSQLVTPRRGG